MINELLTAMWQGGVIALGLLVILAILYIVIYWFSWGSAPHWIEAFRDQSKLRYLADNRFWPWVHEDTQYWIVHLRFDKGPVVVEGKPPRARYWSLAYYPVKRHNVSIDTQSVILSNEGLYKITLDKIADPNPERQVEQQTIKVDEDLKRGIIELRITLQEPDEPVFLPTVSQGGVALVEGGEL